MADAQLTPTYGMQYPAANLIDVDATVGGGDEVYYVTEDGLPCDADGVVCSPGGTEQQQQQQQDGWYDEAGNYCYYAYEEEEPAIDTKTTEADPTTTERMPQLPSSTMAPETTTEEDLDSDMYGLGVSVPSQAQLRRAKTEGKAHIGDLHSKPTPGSATAAAAVVATASSSGWFTPPKPKHLLAKMTSRRSTLTPLQRVELVLRYRIPVAKWPAYGVPLADPKFRLAAAAAAAEAEETIEKEEDLHGWLQVASDISDSGDVCPAEDAPSIWSLGKGPAASAASAAAGVGCMADTWELLVRCAANRPTKTILDDLIACGWTLDLFVRLSGEDASGRDIWARLLACGFTGRYVQAGGPFYSPVLLTGRLGVGFGQLHMDAALTVQDLLAGEIGAGDVGQFMSRSGWRSVLPYLIERMRMSPGQFCALDYTIPQWTCLLGVTYDLMVRYNILAKQPICARLCDRYGWTALALAAALARMEDLSIGDGTERSRTIVNWACSSLPTPPPPRETSTTVREARPRPSAHEPQDPPPPYKDYQRSSLLLLNSGPPRNPVRLLVADAAAAAAGGDDRAQLANRDSRVCYGWDGLTRVPQ